MLLLVQVAQASPCPEPRFNGAAPAEELARENPLPADRQVLKAGRQLYLGREGGQGCVACHGIKGDGRGPLAERFDPPPRDFTCQQTIRGIPDGQLFWTIRNGSPGTAMPAHPHYSDEQIWQLVHELRRLAR